ncbi:hypothetical protein [Flagellimonas meishanensis]|uniref:hypothetical protein n=1 Tax=Flagellimonas meishanensis TaxID=2873264 RepID=UPI001CA6CFD1|nr:hypothetical protein [[Muricauda] meishanensis]
MAHILKNNSLEVHIDDPLENYQFSRFDWTGKITTLKFQDVPLSISEKNVGVDDRFFGKGFYNEFGIDTALGFEDASIGGWFHKIGIGLLKKDGNEYIFNKRYEIRPAAFEVKVEPNKVIISCLPPAENGYAYFLKKEINLLADGFSIDHYLENTGEKVLATDEYNHNFMAINKDLIGPNYLLKFPFQLKPTLFDEMVNPEDKVVLGNREFRFKGENKEPFFFSNLTGGESVDAEWELLNLKSGIGIRETGNFKTNKINLWGWEHVVSPELFHKIRLEPGQSTEWSRTYLVFSLP